MHDKVIKIDNNNLKWKWIFMPSKSKIEKYSYLPRINLCELVDEAKQRPSKQRDLFTIYCAGLNND